jgi:hypothetical protein
MEKQKRGIGAKWIREHIRQVDLSIGAHSQVSLDPYRRESLKILAIFKEMVPRGEIGVSRKLPPIFQLTF